MHTGKAAGDIECKDGPASALPAARGVLAQCERMLLMMTPQAYSGESAIIPGGTVGRHLRHLLDHYAAILAVVDAPASAVIDYDHRERDLPMETSLESALARVAQVKRGLEACGTAALDRAAKVRVMVSGDGAELDLASTIHREFAFATHHAVHHQAMMRAIAREFGVEVGDDFGVAPSTLHHHRAQGARAGAR